MRTFNFYYFNAYSFICKLALLSVCGFLFACSSENNTKQILSANNQIQISDRAVNINTASAAELETLPHVGAKTAQKIIEHRERFGRFRKPEHLMFIRQISDKRFREMRSFIKTE